MALAASRVPYVLIAEPDKKVAGELVRVASEITNIPCRIAPVEIPGGIIQITNVW